MQALLSGAGPERVSHAGVEALSKKGGNSVLLDALSRAGRGFELTDYRSAEGPLDTPALDWSGAALSLEEAPAPDLAQEG